MEHVSQAQQEQALGNWQRCRRGVAQYCRQEAQLFSRHYKDVHKDDQWGTVRQVGVSMAAGAMIGCSIAIPIYAIYKGFHGLPVANDIFEGFGLGGVGGAVATTYKTMVSTTVRRWSSEPRPLMR